MAPYKSQFFVIPADPSYLLTAGIQNLLIPNAFETGFRPKDCRNDRESRRYKNNLDNFIELNKFLNNVCIIRVNFLRV